MDTILIDAELEHYYRERLAMSGKVAWQRFLFRASTAFQGAELELYLERVRAHARAYASYCATFKSPFRHCESALFLSSLLMFGAGIVMILTGDLSVFVAGGTAAGVVGMVECARKLADYWRQYGSMETVFREFAECPGE